MNTYKRINIAPPAGIIYADNTYYDNSSSGLASNNVQDAIDEIAGASSAAFTDNFLIADWNLNGALYELVILEATHNKGPSLIIQVYEKNGLLFNEVGTGIEISASGDITLTIASIPNLRFDGKVIIK